MTHIVWRQWAGVIFCLLSAYGIAFAFSQIRDTNVRTPFWILFITLVSWLLSYLVFWIPTKKEIHDGIEEDSGADDPSGAQD